jgi:hypothetical protein
MYFSGLELWLEYCLRHLQIACKAVQVAIPLGQHKLQNKKMQATFKIFLPF